MKDRRCSQQELLARAQMKWEVWCASLDPKARFDADEAFCSGLRLWVVCNSPHECALALSFGGGGWGGDGSMRRRLGGWWWVVVVTSGDFHSSIDQIDAQWPILDT